LLLKVAQVFALGGDAAGAAGSVPRGDELAGLAIAFDLQGDFVH